jgi:hypothetical protein
MEKCIELGVKIEENEDKYEYLYMAMLQRYQSLLNDYLTLHKITYLPYPDSKKLIVERWKKEKTESTPTQPKQPHASRKGFDERSEKSLMGKPAAKKPAGRPQQDRREIVCGNCKSKGHYANNCPQPLNPERVKAINEWRVKRAQKRGKESAMLVQPVAEKESLIWDLIMKTHFLLNNTPRLLLLLNPLLLH